MKKKDENEKYKRLHISIEPKLFNKLNKLITASNQNRSEIIRNAIRDYIKKSKY